VSHPQNVTIQQQKLYLGSAGTGVGLAGLLLGVIGLGAAAYYGLGSEDLRKHFYHSYLFAFTVFLTITLGAIFFILLHHLTRAGWSVTVRPIAEGVSMTIFLMVILAIPLIPGTESLYHWAHHDAAATDEIIRRRGGWQTMNWFLIRMAAYFVIWCLLVWFYRRESLRQDQTGDAKHSLRMEKVGGPGMIIFGFSLTFFMFDWIMGLNSHWFSTIFGVYIFAGSALSFLSVLVLLSLWLQRKGLIGPVINHEHYHDLGKWMFAFTFFWGYIAFSQYMLIWYANMPEETQFYIPRQLYGWGILTIVLLIVHLLIPFPGMLSRHVKRVNAVLAFWAVWALCSHVLDMYWLIMPNQWINEIPEKVGDPHLALPSALPFLIDSTHNIYGLKGEHLDFLERINFAFQPQAIVVTVGCLVGMAGLYVFVTMRALKGKSLVPLKDPRLLEALKFENI